MAQLDVVRALGGGAGQPPPGVAERAPPTSAHGTPVSNFSGRCSRRHFEIRDLIHGFALGRSCMLDIDRLLMVTCPGVA